MHEMQGANGPARRLGTSPTCCTAASALPLPSNPILIFFSFLFFKIFLIFPPHLFWRLNWVVLLLVLLPGARLGLAALLLSPGPGVAGGCAGN